MLKDIPKSNLKAHPRSSKITFDLVPFQNYAHSHIQIKNPYPNTPPTHQGSRAACVAHGSRGSTECQLGEQGTQQS